MFRLLSYIVILFTVVGCQSAANPGLTNAPVVVKDIATVMPPADSVTPVKGYTVLEYKKVEVLRAAPGTKSVLFNSNGSRLYAMNLEGMSIYEFDQASRRINREFRFKPTKGKGWDYATDKPIESYEEKPVEACLSHDDQFLWVSLHNAGGIVPIRIDSLAANQADLASTQGTKQVMKRVRVHSPGGGAIDSFYVPLIKTGKTPKIISRTKDNRNLLVSNWHSNNVSVLEIDKTSFPFGKVVATVPVASIPRGIVVDDAAHRSFVAIMGGATITVINNSVWMKESDINVESNPRHIVLDTSGHMFISYNKLAKVACIDVESGNTLFTAPTHAQPRTIILSKNQKFLFVTCYSSDVVEVFRIDDHSFTNIGSLACKGHPVGVDIFENNDTLEAWVCSYTNGSISVFSFAKK